jgi:ATP-dependent protease ClpP protease subunit
MSKPIFLNEKKNSDTVEVNIIGRIGSSMFEEGYTKEDAKNDILKNKDKNLVVNLFSGGGSLYDGLFIRDCLAMHPMDTVVNVIGMAGSSATIISTGAKRVRMSTNATFVIHEPSFSGTFNPTKLAEAAKEMEQLYGIMLSIYQAKTGLNEPELRDMMNNTDKIFTAQEALKYGFVDELFTPLAIAAELQSKAETGEFIDETIKTNLIDMEVQNKYDELSTQFNALQNELENMTASFDALTAVKASFESKVEEMTNELNQVKSEKDALTTEIASLKEAQVVAYIDNAVASGKIVEPLRESYLTLAKTNLDVVKNIIDTIPVRVSVSQILAVTPTGDAFSELVKGKEGWDEVDYMSGKDGKFDKTETRATLAKIKELYPTEYNLIHMKAYDKAGYEKIKNKSK